MRVRFAPSPTGYLHVGGAHTALFNWLFARHHRGAFVLRIEDTDAARSKPEFAEAIFSGLRWLGLDWDEGPDKGGPYGPYAQSERSGFYVQAAAALEDDGFTYRCFCAPDKQTDQRACTCRALEPARASTLLARGQPAVVKFRVDRTRPIAIEDAVRGIVSFPAGSVDDFILSKSNGDPLYNFAAVVDDRAMQITHVIRGEEHLANTPRQLLIYEALSWAPPVFAHIPIILNEQRRKLSKRDGATFLDEYERLGYLPEALVNFLALLGWSPGGDRELMSLAEMIQRFELADVVKHAAIFDIRKLSWMNKEYLRKAPLDDLTPLVLKLLASQGLGQFDGSTVAAITALFRDRVQTVSDIVAQGWYFFADNHITPATEALAKYCNGPEPIVRLGEVRQTLGSIEDFKAAAIEDALRALAQRSGCKPAAYIHPLRVALTGQTVSPGIFEVCAVLGQEKVLARIDALVDRLRGFAQEPLGVER